MVNKLQACYFGKAKTIYETDNPEQFIMEFRDDATAFNAKKHAKFSEKGSTNNAINSFIMMLLAEAGIENHFIKKISDNEAIVKSLNMIPLECVVRNRSAGSICKRLGIGEGIDLSPPVFEFFLKDDDLGDPFINDSHIITMGYATVDEITQLKQKTLEVNNILQPLFNKAGLILVDFKLEFGRYDGKLLLGDEFTPDGCRLWDKSSHEKMDKDRFRQDLGNLVESYKTVADRLGIDITK